MKLLVTALFLFISSVGIAQRVFYFNKGSAAERENIITIPIESNTYDIYIRQICLQTKRKLLCNCPVGIIPDSLTRVEMEYLFIQKAGDKIVYITNYPDQFEELQADTGFNVRNGDVTVNPWYFSKFYFGHKDSSREIIIFKQKNSKKLEITYRTSLNEILFHHLTEYKGDKNKSYDIDKALSPVTIFTKQKTFHWSFGEYCDDRTVIPLSQNAILIKDDNVYFELSNQQLYPYCCLIRFNADRLATEFP